MAKANWLCEFCGAYLKSQESLYARSRETGGRQYASHGTLLAFNPTPLMALIASASRG
jgi:hypothetical protein